MGMARAYSNLGFHFRKEKKKSKKSKKVVKSLDKRSAEPMGSDYYGGVASFPEVSIPSTDRIPLQSQLADSDDGQGLGGPTAFATDLPMDLAESYEDRELQKALTRRSREPSAFKHDDLALEISDSDSDDDLALTKPRKAAIQPDGTADSDLEEDSGGVAREDLVGGAGWAGQKKYFYGGNPNERGRRAQDGLSDDELSETEMEALESQKLQTKQLELMDEEDFFDAFTLPSDHTGKKKSKPNKALNDLSGQENIKMDLSKLSKKEKAKLFAEESPEFAGILHDFDAKMTEAQNVLAPLIELINEGKIPAGPAADFLKTRYELILNYCTNISSYLTFKIKRIPLKYHPLTGKLLQYKQLLDRMEPLKDTLMPQITEVLSQIQAGQTIETLVKQAKRRVRLAEMGLKKKASKKRLRILEPSLNGGEEERTAKSDKPEVELTMDERKAVEMYDAMRGKKNIQEDSEDGESEPEEEIATNGEAMGEEERRSITYQMAKNKGLTPKRSKLQRNPRVKNRKKFEKAKVRRKGQVREVRTETTKYSGEYSGINARVKKGIKLA
ncbi:something about silencing protein 10-like [Tigriopus californicus]|uniref:something about silencing protein 10-like n=1 Tax=Tigriopus californicus TaxID=6832 RepID=UPI0027DA03B3|nr:something about silencing protein 10-like [Tigriopus californicus]